MSLINPNNIDGQYPIAGQDNDSQGFRDNFTNIKNNFTIAYNELADLQGKVVLKSALSGGSIDNNMSYSILEAAQLKKAVETKRNIGTISGSGNDISWADGHFQFFTTSGDVTIGLSGWPTNSTYAKLRLQITTDTTNRAVTFPAAVSVGLADIQGAAGQTITFPTAGVYLFELTTVDNGTTITIQDLLRNYDIVTTGLTGTFTTVNATTLNVGTPLGNLRVTGNVIGGLAQFASINSTPIGNATPSTGAFSTLTATTLTATTLTATTLTATGAIIESGYQFYQPDANVAIQANVGVSRVILAPISSALVSFSANVTLPNTAVDGTVVSISSNSAVQFFSVMAPYPDSGRQITPHGNVALAAGDKAEYLYRSSNNTWYKVG